LIYKRLLPMGKEKKEKLFDLEGCGGRGRFRDCKKTTKRAGGGIGEGSDEPGGKLKGGKKDNPQGKGAAVASDWPRERRNG